MKKVFFAILVCLLFIQVKAQSDEFNMSVDNLIYPEVHYSLFIPETRTYRAAATYPGAVLFEWKTMSPGWTIMKAGPGTNDMHDVLITPDSSSASTTMLVVRAFDGVEWSDWTAVGYVSMTDSYSLFSISNWNESTTE